MEDGSDSESFDVEFIDDDACSMESFEGCESDGSDNVIIIHFINDIYSLELNVLKQENEKLISRCKATACDDTSTSFNMDV